MNAMNENQQPDEDENKQTQDEGSDDSFLDSLEEDGDEGGDEDTSDYDVEIDDLDDLTIEERSENILEEVNNIYNDESETASNKLAILQEIASSLEETIMNLEEEIDDGDGEDYDEDEDEDYDEDEDAPVGQESDEDESDD